MSYPNVLRLLAISSCLVGALARAETVVTVKVSGIKTEQGRVQATLFSEATREAFPGGEGAQRQFAAAKREGATLVFRVAQPGFYAVAVTHDVNGDGKLETNLLGMPKEPVGNSGEPAKAKPTFEASRFRVDRAEVEVPIEVRQR